MWDVLTGIEQWPSWNPDVKSVSMDGGLSEGSVFRWRVGPATIRRRSSRRTPRRVAWSGKTFGLEAIHVYALEGRERQTLVQDGGVL